MRTLIVLTALLAVGCAPTPSLKELEAEAEVTGDWTEVERYERMLARREARNMPSCRSGEVRYCEDYIGGERCACADGDRVRAMLIRR